MPWTILADAVMALHAAYVAFVVVGFLAIPIGAAFRASWVRNTRLRVLHLAAMAVVLLESFAGIPCPLTVMEDAMRTRAGDAAGRGDFILRCLHGLIFHDWPPWVFVVLYTIFTAAIVVLMVVVPPRPARDRVESAR
jgi:ABC-type multidrug transport system permease subunit